jgi:hypothetical protein
MFFLISMLRLSNTKCDSILSFTAGCLGLTFLVGQYACMYLLYKVLKKSIFHNGFVCHSTAPCYSPLQTKHFVILLFLLQFILLKILYIYLKKLTLVIKPTDLTPLIHPIRTFTSQFSKAKIYSYQTRGLQQNSF